MMDLFLGPTDMNSLQTLKIGYLLFIILLSTAIFRPVLSQEPDPQCTNSRIGLPACNFDHGNCFREVLKKEETQAWKLVKGYQEGPVKPFDDGYVFLNYLQSEGKPRSMEAQISKDTKAICAELYFSTTGSASAPITLYLRDGLTYSVMHKIHANTGGNWKHTNFSCCLPDPNIARSIVIEATSQRGNEVAIDYVDLRHSNMPCDNDRLVCYPRPPSQAPLEPEGDSPICPGEDEAGAQSCDFTADGHMTDYCGWTASLGWNARQKRGGTGVYDVIYAKDKPDASLVSAIGDAVAALCVEVQFAADDANAGAGDNVTNVFSLNILDGFSGQTVSPLWGEPYIYARPGGSGWKRKAFVGCLPPGKNRQIELMSNTKGLRIDYIYMRKSNKTCRPAEPTSSLVRTSPAGQSTSPSTVSAFNSTLEPVVESSVLLDIRVLTGIVVGVLISAVVCVAIWFFMRRRPKDFIV